jgi:hypothetical protein
MEDPISSVLEFALAVLGNLRTAIAAVVFAMFSYPNAILPDKWRQEYDRQWPVENRRKWLLQFSIGYIFVSCFLAWNDQHTKVIKFAECSNPDHRCLTDEQKRQLTTELIKLKSITSKITLSITNGDAKSGPYVQDFASAIRTAGLGPIWGFTSPDNSDQVGVIIALKDPKLPPPGSEPLRTALRDIGIEPKILAFPSAGFSFSGVDISTFKPDMVLWVAEKPF